MVFKKNHIYNKDCIIYIQGTWYMLLCMYNGYYTVSKLFDINNEIERRGIIWEHQPFFHHNELWYGNILNFLVKLIRVIKQFIIKDAFGNRY